jgi:hypothetical protein
MKMSSKIFAFVYFSVLICFIFNTYSSRYLDSITLSHGSHAPLEENYFSLSSSILYCPVTKTENTIQSFNNLLPNCIKNNLIDYTDCFKETELQLINSYAKYILISNNLTHTFSSTDIIYPFHYFW